MSDLTPRDIIAEFEETRPLLEVLQEKIDNLPPHERRAFQAFAKTPRRAEPSFDIDATLKWLRESPIVLSDEDRHNLMDALFLRAMSAAVNTPDIEGIEAVEATTNALQVACNVMQAYFRFGGPRPDTARSDD